MRDFYREQLDDVIADLVHMAQLVSSSVRSATTALLEADIHMAEQVIDVRSTAAPDLARRTEDAPR